MNQQKKGKKLRARRKGSMGRAKDSKGRGALMLKGSGATPRVGGRDKDQKRRREEGKSERKERKEHKMQRARS